MTEYAESCYLRWINCDDLTEVEEQIAVDYQELIESDEPDDIGVEIPPDIVVSPEEFEAFIKIATKLQRSGLSSLINAMIGNAVTPSIRTDCLKGKDMQ